MANNIIFGGPKKLQNEYVNDPQLAYLRNMRNQQEAPTKTFTGALARMLRDLGGGFMEGQAKRKYEERAGEANDMSDLANELRGSGLANKPPQAMSAMGAQEGDAGMQIEEGDSQGILNYLKEQNPKAYGDASGDIRERFQGLDDREKLLDEQSAKAELMRSQRMEDFQTQHDYKRNNPMPRSGGVGANESLINRLPEGMQQGAIENLFGLGVRASIKEVDLGGGRKGYLNTATNTMLSPVEQEDYLKGIQNSASAKTFGEGQGRENVKSSVGAAKAYDQLEKSNNTLAEMKQAVVDGADIGPISNRFMSFSPASVIFDNLRGVRGLEVVSSITFGALSEKELRLAMEVGTPNLKDQPMLDWIDKKIAAQNKMMENYKLMTEYFNDPNASADGWMKKREALQGQWDAENDPLGVR